MKGKKWRQESSARGCCDGRVGGTEADAMALAAAIARKEHAATRGAHMVPQAVMQTGPAVCSTQKACTPIASHRSQTTQLDATVLRKGARCWRKHGGYSAERRGKEFAGPLAQGVFDLQH